MNLFLIRHGETSHNKERRILGIADLPLTHHGRQQAKAAAKTLVAEAPFALYSSPLARAMETASAIGDLAGVAPIPIDGFSEADVGLLEGLSGIEMRERYPEFMQHWQEDPGTAQMPEGETLQQVQLRAWKGLLSVYDQHSADTVVLVGHNFTNLTVITRMLGLPLKDFRTLNQNLCGITRIDMSDDQYKLISLNETAHLRAENLL